MNSDDPKLTAYALDELDPAERAEIEQLLRDDPATAAEIKQTSAFAARLRRELRAEAAAPLTDSQRAELVAAASEHAPAKNPGHPERSVGGKTGGAQSKDPVSSGSTSRRSTIVAFPLRKTLLWAAALGLIASGAFLLSQIKFTSSRLVSAREVAAKGREEAARVQLLAEDAPANRLSRDSNSSLISSEGREVEALPAPLPPAALESPTIAPSPRLAVSTPTALPHLAAANKPEQWQAAIHLEKAMANPIRPAATPASVMTDALTKIRDSGKLAGFTMSGRMDGTSRASAEEKVGSGAFVNLDEPVGTKSPRETRELTDPDRPASMPHPYASTAGDTEAYDAITDNAFLAARDNPLSTFSIDVDTASYSNVRRFLNQQTRPPKGAVRIEELLNYFTYDYPQPEGDAPFSATMEVAACPWAPEHRLVRIGLKGREIAEDKRPATNLVFLIDVSGSMQPQNKLPLLRKSLGLLVDRLTDNDTVSIAVYAGASGTVLEPTHSKREIRNALDRLESGGSTNGGAGIQLAYRLAEQSFIKGGVNRVILATDGDFNVGVTSQSELTDLITRKAKKGTFLTVLGFGMGNLKDSTLEKLADKGNGNYAYIDTLNEGRKVLVEQMNGTLVTIAKDVKIQVEFNPAQAAAYRLIGYENRLLAKEDFNDDKKDAGEIGAGHTVTALYEVVPAGRSVPGGSAVDALKYQESEVRSQKSEAEKSEIRNQKSEITAELLTLKLRYKAPDGETSKLLEFPLTDRGETWEKSSRDFRFAAAVASFGMLLRDSPHKGNATWSSARELAVEGQGEDRSGYRGEFLTLLDKARALAR